MLKGDTTNLLIIRSKCNSNGINSRIRERGRAGSFERRTGARAKSGIMSIKRSSVSIVVRNSIKVKRV